MLWEGPWRRNYTRASSMVMVPARAVGVAVADLFRGGVAHVDHLHVELQRLPRQRVVGVDADLVALDADDGDDARAGLRLRLELHAGADVLDIAEVLARHRGDELLVAVSVRLVRRNRRGDVLAGGFALQR